MKRIGLTQRVDEIAEFGERRDALDQRWTMLASEAGFFPVPVPNMLTNIADFVSDLSLQGVILTGGNTLVEYGGNAPERDRLERALLEFALRNFIPVLGVCRGAQMIYHYWGGRLMKVPGHVGRPTIISWDGGERMVNSYHEFAVVEVPEWMTVLARARDGTIEAFQHKSLSVTGMMWHPERSWPPDPVDIIFLQKALRLV